MYIDSDIITNVIALLDRTSGSCSIIYSDGTIDAGSAVITWDSAYRSLKAICTFTPSGNKTVTSVLYSFSLCLGNVSLKISGISFPVIANYSHVVVATAKLTQPS